MIPHPQLFFGAILLGAAALVAWAFWMLPQWSRPGIYFSVTVLPEFRKTEEARRLLKKYRLHAMVYVAIGFGAILAGAFPAFWFLLIIGIVLLAFGPLFAFLAARKGMLPHAAPGATVREAALEPRVEHLSGRWIAQIGPFAILAGTGAYLYFRWDAIPARFPVHWGINGQPDEWSVRTPLGVCTPLLLAAIIVFGISVISYVLRHYARALPAPGSRPITQDFRTKVAIFLLIIEFLLTTVSSLVALLPLLGNLPLLIVTIATFPMILVLIAWLAKGRVPYEGGHASLTGPGLSIGDGTLDKYWKLGIFYFNPDDAALFVERRFGLGYTVNFAHGAAWLLLGLLLAVPIAVALLLVHEH